MENKKLRKEKSLKDYSSVELFKELATRKNIYVTEDKEFRTEQYIDKYPITNCELTLYCKYNSFTDEIVE